MTIIETIRMATEVCFSCGTVFAMTADMQQRRRDDKKTFYCPNGHAQIYGGETEAQKHFRLCQDAQRALAAERARHDQTKAARDSAEASLRATKGVATRIRNRVSKGVCPCCNRTFMDLQRHMVGQHPDFAKEAK